MKKILISITSIIVLLIAAVAVLPSVISWDQYKDEITSKVKEATGRDVVINGAIKLRILPSPSIIVNDIQVGNPQGFQSNSAFASLKKIEIGAALQPLLKKQIHITGVSLVEPVIHMQKTSDGKTNWEFEGSQNDTTQAASSDSISSFQPKLSFDEIKIENGAALYSDSASEPKQLNGLNAQLKGDSLKGPFILNGQAQYNTVPLNFAVKTDSLETGKPLSLTTTVSTDNGNASVKFVGKFGGNEENSGNVSLLISDPEGLVNRLKGGNEKTELPELLAKKIEAKGTLVQSKKAIELKDLELAVGKISVKGIVTYSEDQKLGVSLSTGTVDLRDGTDAKKTKKENTQTSQTPYVQTIDNIFKSLQNVMGTPVPNDLTAGLELRLQKVITQDGANLNNIVFSALLDENGPKISNFSAQLSGNTAFSMNAALPLSNGKVSALKSNITFKSDKTDQALKTFGVNDLPRGFSPFNANAKITVTEKNLIVSDTTFEFAKNNLNGLGITYATNNQIPLAINISGGDLDFNTLKPIEKESSEAIEQKTKTEDKPLGLPADMVAKLADLKVNIDLKLDQIIIGDNLARNITIKSNLNGETLTIEEASIGDLGDLNSLNLNIAGVVGKLSPFDALDLAIKASSDDLSRTLWAFGNQNAADLGKANFTATVKGNQENVVIKANGQVDSGQINIDGTVSNLANNPFLTGTISAKHPETAIVLRNFANVKTDKSKMGPFSLSSKVVASNSKFKTEELIISMGDQGSLNGNINFDKTVSPGVIDVALTADFLPLGSLTGAKTNRIGGGTNSTAAPKTWSQKPIDFSALRGTSGTIKLDVKKLTYDAFVFDNFAMLTKINNGTVTLENLSANMFEGSFSTKGQLTAGQTGNAHKGQFTINVTKANVEKVFQALGSEVFGSGILTFDQSLNFTGKNQLDLIKSLNGKGNVTIENGTFNGLDLDSLADKIDRPNSPSDFLAIINQAQAGGTSSFETVEAPITIQNGIIQSNDVAIKSAKSQIDLGGQVNIPSQNLKLDGEISFLEQKNLPGLGLTIFGPLYEPQKKLKTDNIIRFYTQKATQELGQKALNKLFGTQPPTTNETSSEDTIAPTEAAPQETPQDVEDVLKQQGEQLLRGLLGQ